MQVAVLEGDRVRGTLEAEQRGLYTAFRAQVETEEVCRLYGIFEGGEASLGVPAPEDGRMLLRISVPTSRLPEGRLLRGELRTGGNASWRRFSGGKVGDATLPPGLVRGNTYRFPWRAGDRLPCEEYLCFFHFRQEGGRGYLELTLDEKGFPKV